MDTEHNGKIINLLEESTDAWQTDTVRDLSPLIEYAKAKNKRLADLSAEELKRLRCHENVQQLPMWEMHYIQGHRCRLKIRMDGRRVLRAEVEHDDMTHAPQFAIVNVDGEWRLTLASLPPFIEIENWAAIDRCVQEAAELWEEKGKWYLQNYSQQRSE